MKIFKSFVTILLLTLSIVAYGQTLSLELPIKEEVKIGQALVIQLHSKGITSHKIKMTGSPESAVIENDKFIWTPKSTEKKYYLITFQLLDSTNHIVDERNLALTVKGINLAPELIFDKKIADTIYVTENEQFTLSAKIKSQQGTDSRLVIPYFTFNENPNLRQFENSKVTILGDQLVFTWTPSNEEAQNEFLKFRITLIDIDQSIYSRVLNFKVKNVNQSPYFVHQPIDTVYQKEGQELIIDYSAIDPDHDKLSYSYSPSNPQYSFLGERLVVKSENTTFPLQVFIRVSDGVNTLKHHVHILKDIDNKPKNSVNQPVVVIGDLTRKTFSEGDSIETYLNISDENDAKQQVELSFSDLNLSPGIQKLSPHLIFEKKGTYIQIKSKGVLPFSLVDRDYTYNISFKMTALNGSVYSKILVFNINNKADPFSISRQKDSLITLVNSYLETESTYKSTIQKVHGRISKPWWKKAAVITGTLSGVLTLVQASNKNHDMSIVAATVSLASIVISNLPTLSENKLNFINNKITESNSRSDIVKKKLYEFNSMFLFDVNQTVFDLKKKEIEELVRQNNIERNRDICLLLTDKKTSRKLKTLILQGREQKEKLEEIFKCIK